MRYVLLIINKFEFPIIPNSESIISHKIIPMEKWDLRVANRFIRDQKLTGTIYDVYPIIKGEDVELIKSKGFALVYRHNDYKYTVIADIEHTNCCELKSYLRDDKIKSLLNEVN